MPALIADRQFALVPAPAARFGAGTVRQLPELVRAAGRSHALVVTDSALARTPVAAAVTEVLAAAGLPAAVFDGVHPNPTTGDLARGAAAAAAFAAPEQTALVALGGGSSIDAAKGIALAAVNPQRGRDLDYRSEFAAPGLPIVAVPTTAGTGAETNAFGVVTDVAAGRKFYVGHASTRPVAAVLDPDLTAGLPPGPTAATGMDALTHALESYLSVRANPWSDALALQVIKMAAQYLPRAVADGADAEARAQMLLAAHMAGVAMASTGLGLCHAIGHAIGGRFGVAHGVALAMVLPQVLAFNQPACGSRLADIGAALGAAAPDDGQGGAAAVEAVAALADRVGLRQTLAGSGITEADYGQIAADALADEVLANTPRPPTAADIRALLAGQPGAAGG